jgi:hypothetical protein
VAGAILAGLLAAGCRQSGAVAPLKEDPVLAAELQAEAAREMQHAEDRKALEAMTLADAARLETVVTRNPEDLETRGRLLAFYRLTGRSLQPRDVNRAAIRRHVAWVTEHHPDSILLTAVIRRDEDPIGYAQIRELWRPHIEKSDASLAVLSLASAFFFASEPEIAERLMVRMQEIPVDPAEAGSIHDRAIMPVWGRLGALYAQVLRAPGRPGATIDAGYVADVKARLDASRDAPLLAAVAQGLVLTGATADDDLTRLAHTYLDRAVAIDPDHPHVGHVRNSMERSRVGRPDVKLQIGAPASEADVADRTRRLACDAELRYRMARGAREREMLTEARTFAEQALAAPPPQPPRDPLSCDPMFRANLVLALVTWRQGDRQATLRYLTEASKAPAPAIAALRRFPVDIEAKLTNSLLKHGERETVAAYLEQASKARTPGDRARMLEEAKAIRDGRMPARYQRLLARGHI